MADLTGATPASTYGGLLQVPNSNNGVDSTLRTVQDGKGNNTQLKLSTNAVGVGNITDLESYVTSISTGSITGAITLDSTAFGKLYIVSGTAADYTVGLPTAVGNSGKVIAFKGSDALTRFVTLDANSTETIDGSLTLILWSKEYVVLMSDGSNWKVNARYSRGLWGFMRLTANQSGIVTATQTKVNLDATDADNSSRMCDTINHRITVKRAGWYRISSAVIFASISAASLRNILSIYVNGVASYSFEVSSYASGTYPSPRGSFALQLSAGDYVELYCQQNSGANQSIAGSTTSSTSFLEVLELNVN